MAYLGQGLELGQAERFTYTATGGETSVSIDDRGVAINYTVGQVDVYLNGSHLVNGTDFTATTGSTITGLAALSASDVVDIVALSTFQAADHYTKAEADVYFADKPARNTTLNQEAVTQGTSTRTGFSSTKYTGNNEVDQSITTGVDMASSDSQHDFGGLVWIKEREAITGTISGHILADTVRGATNYLSSSSTSVETTASNAVSSFNATGFNTGISAGTNEDANTYIAWSWQTNQKTTGLTNRNKAYTCHYNTDLGFSIVGYEADGQEGHEIPTHLPTEAELTITKRRDGAGTEYWVVTSPLIGDGKMLRLNDVTALEDLV